MKIFKSPPEVPPLPKNPKPDWQQYLRSIEKITLPKIIPDFPQVKRFIVFPVKEDFASLVRSYIL